MLKVCDGCKDGLDTDQDGSSISTIWVTPFRANGAHPIVINFITIIVWAVISVLLAPAL